jgi:hypothetical protein
MQINYTRYLIVKYQIALILMVCFAAVSVGATCSPDIISYWKMDEVSGDLYVDDATGYNATCAGDCPEPISNGRISGAQLFNAISTGIEIPANGEFDWSSSDSFTIEVWFKRSTDNFSGDEVIVGRNDFAASNLNWWLGLNSSGGAGFTLESTNGDLRSLSGIVSLTDDAWHHLAAVRDAASNQIFLFIDGQKADSAPAAYGSGFESASSPISIGWLDTAPYYHFGGTADEIAIHNRALSEVEIRQHFYDGYVGLGWGYCGCGQQVRIMPLGDSITNGYISPAIGDDFRVGYRQKLYFDLIDIGYDQDFVGSLTRGKLAYPVFDIDNEGHGGWNSYDIAGSVYAWLQTNPPDIVLLHIGTNSLEVSAQGVELILNEIDRFSEDITVVLAKIINQRDYSPTVSAFNSNLEAMVDERISNGDRIILVDQEQALIYPYDLADNLHPYLTGYEKMAGTWVEGLLKILPVCGELFPMIYSSPHTKTIVGSLYTYPVKASGNPFPVYTLLNAPATMSIDENTGLIEWVPTTSGWFDISVSASNSAGTFTQNFRIDVGADSINDNGETGTSFTGSWNLSAGPNYYGSQSVYNREPGGGTYTFTANSVPGPTDVTMWWTSSPFRCEFVPVELYDGETLLDTHYINQQANGGQWYYLGTYEIFDSAKVVIVSEGDSCSTNADAVRFLTGISPDLDSILIEGPAVAPANSNTSYALRAYYTDGTNQLVPASGLGYRLS